MKHLLRSFLAGIALAGTVQAQPQLQSTTLLVDVTSTRSSMIDPRARVDVFVVVPYESIQFTEYDQIYAAKYDVRIAIRDSAGRRSVDTAYTRTATEKDYAAAQGGTGNVDHSVPRFRLNPGTYKIEVAVRDQFSRKELSQTRTITIPDYTTTLPALSSILLLTDIEQREERYSITPLIGDVVWNSDASLFAFYEIYLEDSPETVGVQWKLAAKDGRVLSSGAGPIQTITGRTGRQFFKISLPKHPMPGTYTLGVSLYGATGKKLDTTAVLARQQRTLTIPPSAFGSVVSDLSKAIRQLRYVATQSDMDYIQEGTTENDKQTRFEEFWKKLDPTSNTTRNEAFEDYYARIEKANALYKSYTDGWLTDMGMVFIIYGEPAQAERYGSTTGTPRYIRWTMSNGVQFNFEDTSGFGDFRLRTPLPAGAKYQYRR
jgi:GWxTD domain-containing protein